MNQKLFRKESLDRMSSPDQLNQYIRVSNPSVWLILSAVIVLLIAVCVWGSVGRMETALNVNAVVKDEQVICLLDEEQRLRVEAGMTLRAGEQSGEITQIYAEPVSYEILREKLGEYELYASGISEGSWRYVAIGTLPLTDGMYGAKIVIESVSPLSFLVN